MDNKTALDVIIEECSDADMNALIKIVPDIYQLIRDPVELEQAKSALLIRADQIGDKNDDKNWIDRIVLKETIRSLSDREKRILALRFLKGKTQMEVAGDIGISQAQVSRLEKSVLNKIKREL